MQNIGFAHNNGKIWICKDEYKCNKIEWKSMKDYYLGKLVASSSSLSEVEKRTEDIRRQLQSIGLGRRW